MKVKLTLPNAKVPFRAHPTDAGADLYSPESFKLFDRQSYLLDLGFQMELPPNTVGLVFSRSSTGNKGLNPKNCVGVIDEKYRGNLKMMVCNTSGEHCKVEAGDRIAQLVILPVLYPEFTEVDEIDLDDDRGGGHGSTGR